MTKDFLQLRNNRCIAINTLFKVNTSIGEQDSYQFAIIDTDRRDIELFETSLRMEGCLDFSLKIWHEFEPALQYFSNIHKLHESTTPDAIFIDFSMLGVNGSLALQLLRQIKFLDNTPIIVYSSPKRASIIKDFKHNNVTGFFKKPIDARAFLEFLRR